MPDEMLSKIIDLLLAIQRIPAPTFGEAQRATFMFELFRSEGLQDVSLSAIGNVYARLPGLGSRPPLVVAAHLDTVFPENADLTVRVTDEKITGPGIGDNTAGLAGLLGLLWTLRLRQVVLPGDLWLVATVGEEGLGDLRGMRAVVDRFEDQPLAYLVVEGMSLGQIYHRALNVQRFRITARTEGGHSWVDHGRPSAVHEVAHLASRLTSLDLPSQPRTTLNVGVISGGTTVNSIAAQAHLELDLRSEDAGPLADLVAQMERLVRETNRQGVHVIVENIGQRPVGEIPTDHPLVRLAVDCLQSLGITPMLSIGSTDANVPLSRGYAAICVGLTTGSGVHTMNEFINVQPLSYGIQQLVGLVEGIFRNYIKAQG